MSKYILFLCLILQNLRLFGTEFVVLDEDLSEVKPFDATKYLRLLSKVSENENKTTFGANQSPNSILSENVRHLRTFFDPSKEAPTEKCQYVVLYFGLILSQFVECVLINEIPFSLCLSCSQQYSDLSNAYSDLINTSVSNCSDSFLNSHKIASINGFFKNSVFEWTDGNCDSCFAGKDKYRNLVINNDTEYYFELTNNYMNCLQIHNQTTLGKDCCVSCKQMFYSVNDYYDLIQANYSSHVCNDITDSMKDIRKHWSETLNCPIETNSSIHFLALVFIVMVFPFALYLIGRLFCVENSSKTLMKQKRLSTYHLPSYENEPLIQR